MSTVFTKTFEQTFVFDPSRKPIINSSNSWDITFANGTFEIAYDTLRRVSWKQAVITIRQHGQIILEVLFTKDYPWRGRHSVVPHRADPLQVFHATVTETYEKASGSQPSSSCQGSSVDIIDITDDVLDSEPTQMDAVPENSFDQPTEVYNTVLVLGEKRVYVSKEFLAIHSLFFEKLFFGEFAEKGKSEVVLKDIDHDKFVEFLRVLLPNGKPVTRKNVHDVLFVANYVQCAHVLKKCTRFLLKDDSFSMLEKLRLADKYELTAVMDALLDEMTIPDLQVAAKQGKEEFSVLLKARICDRLV